MVQPPGFFREIRFPSVALSYHIPAGIQDGIFHKKPCISFDKTQNLSVFPTNLLTKSKSYFIMNVLGQVGRIPAFSGPAPTYPPLLEPSRQDSHAPRVKSRQKLSFCELTHFGPHGIMNLYFSKPLMTDG